MQQAEAYTENNQCLEIADYKSASQAMEDALSRRLPSFYKSAYRLLGNAADAEDAVQDALFAAYKHLDQFRGEAQMSTWLTAIVCNSARMQLRRRSRQNHVPLEEKTGEEQEHSLLERLADHRPNPEDQCRSSELNARIRSLATQLSPGLRRTFLLRDLQGLSICETAKLLGLSNGTVKAQLARARAKLKDLMRRSMEPRIRRPRTRKPSPAIARSKPPAIAKCAAVGQ